MKSPKKRNESVSGLSIDRQLELFSEDLGDGAEDRMIADMDKRIAAAMEQNDLDAAKALTREKQKLLQDIRSRRIEERKNYRKDIDT